MSASKFIHLDIGPKTTLLTTGDHVGEVASNSVVREIFGLPTAASALLPPVVRCFNPSMDCFLVERTPFIASIWYKDVGTHDKGEFVNYHIPIPWTVYLIRLDSANVPTNMWVWGRPSQMYIEEDELYHLPLPNVHEGGLTCIGTVDWRGSQMQTVGDGITSAIQAFWGSQFNRDLGWVLHCPAYDGTAAIDGDDIMRSWEKMSIQDAMSATMYKESTVGQVISEHLTANPAMLPPAGMVNKLNMLYRKWVGEF